MKKILILSVLCLMTFASVVDATTTATKTQANYGNFSVWKWITPSQATNAIDTTQVSIGNAAWAIADTSAGASAEPYVLQMEIAFDGKAGTGGSGTVDSCYIGIDVSANGRDWTQKRAITVFNTNAAPTSVLTLSRAYPLLRVRLKNGGAATGRSHVYISYPTKLY